MEIGLPIRSKEASDPLVSIVVLMFLILHRDYFLNYEELVVRGVILAEVVVQPSLVFDQNAPPTNYSENPGAEGFPQIYRFRGIMGGVENRYRD